jgi:hypothetical protein
MSGSNGRVGHNAKMQKKYDNRALPPQMISPNRAAQDGADAANKNGAFPITATHTGHFIRPDGSDTDMAVRRALIQNTGGETPFGVMSAGQETIDYLKHKKEKESYMTHLALVEQMIDSKNPATQAKAYSLAPELLTESEKYYDQWVTDQIMLYKILKQGEINTQEDLYFIAKILRADYWLPTSPAWDPQGALTGAIDGKQLQEGIYRGIFSMRQWGLLGNTNPERYSPGVPDNSTEAKKQMKMKYVIVRRLFPGLRDADDYKILQIVNKISAVTGSATDQDTWSNYLQRIMPDYSTGSGASYPQTFQPFFVGNPY